MNQPEKRGLINYMPISKEKTREKRFAFRIKGISRKSYESNARLSLNLAIKRKRYWVDIENGEVYSLTKGEKRLMKGTKVKDSHIQMRIFPRTGREIVLTFIKSHIVWIAAYNEYSKGMIIKHKDGNVNNCSIKNLFRAADPKPKTELAPQSHGEKLKKGKWHTGPRKAVKFREICLIRQILEDNPKISAKDVTEMVRCTYNSVARTMRLIKKGMKMRKDTPGFIPSPNKGKAAWKDKITPEDYFL